MKILVAGTFRYPIYQEALCHGIEVCGHEPIRLLLSEGRPYSFRLCIKNGYKLLNSVVEQNPDAVFLYRVETIFPSFLKQLRTRYPHIPIAIYHNDDPFRKEWKRFFKSFHYLNCIKYTDITYVYRHVNIEEAYKYGARKVKLYMSHYYSLNDLVELNNSTINKSTDEVAFVGHFEPDNRIEIIDYLFKNCINLHIYGSDWKQVFINKKWPIDHFHKGARGVEYRELINRVGIALAFFSSKNRDEYTRRCFEIPVMGTLIAAPLTNVTNSLFIDGVNALLFSSKEELLQKLQFYNSHIDERNRLAIQGYNNIKNGDFSEVSRAKMVIDDFDYLISNKNNNSSHDSFS